MRPVVDAQAVLQDSQLIPSFVVGQAYVRKEEITGRFGGSPQSGIAPSRRVPAIFIFTGESGGKYGYDDAFDELGCLLYTGEGQKGDMLMTRGNGAILSHAVEGRGLYVFKANSKGQPCVYLGEFVYGSHFIRRGPDVDGLERDVIVFRLVPVSRTLDIELSMDPGTDKITVGIGDGAAPSLDELRTAAITACRSQDVSSNSRETVQATYQRSECVKKYVLARAQGTCELCEQPAPFKRKSDGSPYLEPHHINRLSDGGLDHPLYVGAICPTCHRRIHSGDDGHVQNAKLRHYVVKREAELSRQ